MKVKVWMRGVGEGKGEGTGEYEGEREGQGTVEDTFTFHHHILIDRRSALSFHALGLVYE